jgi:hypothetical protein
VGQTIRRRCGAEKALPTRGEGQLRALLSDAIDKNADGLILSAYPPEGYRMLELMQVADWRPKAMGMTIAPIHPDFYPQGRPHCRGHLRPVPVGAR